MFVLQKMFDSDVASKAYAIAQHVEDKQTSKISVLDVPRGFSLRTCYKIHLIASVPIICAERPGCGVQNAVLYREIIKLTFRPGATLATRKYTVN